MAAIAAIAAIAAMAAIASKAAIAAMGIFTLRHFVGLMWDIVIIMWDYPTSFRFHFGLYI